jgi:hypothetical protein
MHDFRSVPSPPLPCKLTLLVLDSSLQWDWNRNGAQPVNGEGKEKGKGPSARFLTHNDFGQEPRSILQSLTLLSLIGRGIK